LACVTDENSAQSREYNKLITGNEHDYVACHLLLIVGDYSGRLQVGYFGIKVVSQSMS